MSDKFRTVLTERAMRAIEENEPIEEIYLDFKYDFNGPDGETRYILKTSKHAWFHVVHALLQSSNETERELGCLIFEYLNLDSDDVSNISCDE